MKSPHETDVIILGAGVLGVSLAYHLSKRSIRTLVLEREALPATHASGKNAGMIRHLYRHKQLTEWAMRSVESWPERIRKAHFIKTGSYILGRSLPNHHQELFEKQISEKNIPAVLCKRDGLLDSSSYVNSLYQLSREAGAEFYFRKQIRTALQGSSTWQLESTDGFIVRAPWLVNAAGAWASELFPHSQQLLKPYARHLFVVSGWPRGFMPSSSSNSPIGFYWNEIEHWYMRLWDKTSRLVSTCELIPAHPDCFVPNPESKEQLSEYLLHAFPEFATKLTLTHSWHCFRTYAEDQLPIWGIDKTHSGLFWLAGFGGYGMSTSYAASEDAARQIAGETVATSPEFAGDEFGIARFLSHGGPDHQEINVA